MLTETQKEIVRAMAANDLNVSKTARATHRSYSGILYQVTAITEKTGLKPTRFHDLVKLLEISRGGDNA